MRRECDIVIVGAGPAGCSAGISLARGGASVLLAERCTFPREKLCGGLATRKSKELVEGLLGRPVDAIAENRKSSSFSVYDRDRLVNKVRASRELYGFDRPEFDQALFEGAAAAGCRILQGARVADIDFGNRRLRVGPDVFGYTHLIGADGAHSFVGRAAGLPLRRRSVAAGLQCDIPYESLRGDFDGPSIHFGYIKYGWAWAFPKSRVVSFGIAGLGKSGKELRGLFGAFLRERSVEAGKFLVKGGCVPYGTWLDDPATGDAILVGDAAGFADPLTGEGIYHALLSGKLAAEAILEHPGDCARRYNDACEERIVKYLRQAKTFRAFFLHEPFQSLAFRWLIRSDRHMEHFMQVLEGEKGYLDYLADIVRRKVGLGDGLASR